MNVNKIPNLFIVGAAKAGTTSLYNYLKNHDDIFLCPIKEPNFFNKELKFENCKVEIQKRIFLDYEKYFSEKKLEEKHFAILNNLQDYLELYRDVKNEKVIAEFSTSYLQSNSAASEIYKFNPSSKIIVLLRDPVDRTISHYQMDSSKEIRSENILEDLQADYNSTRKGYCISNMYIDLSLYYNGLKKIFETFPKEQVLILQFEDLKKDNHSVLNSICSFLEIDYCKLDNTNTEKIHNQTLVPRLKLIKHSLKLKQIMPKPLLSIFKRLKPIFFKKPNRNEISIETKNYIEMIVKEDYIKTNELISKYYDN